MRFGTDGVRGEANAELTVDVATRLGGAVVELFDAPAVILVRDPRRSGTMFESACAAGVTSAGADALVVGVAPTPVAAALSVERQLPTIMISASHNVFSDNGLKVFAPGGAKLSDEQQHQIERYLNGELLATRARGAGIGTVSALRDPLDAYLETLSAAIGTTRLSGLHVVVDCANGAASRTAETAFRSAGAQVTVLNAAEDGCSINEECGSNHPAGLQHAVVAHGADMGFAFDGDADRVVACDHAGVVIDGDHLIAMLAIAWKGSGELVGNGVAVTVMTNLGFHHAMDRHGIAVVTTPVGDRHIAAALLEHGLALGGEQSGHIICSRFATTGDGVLSALLIAQLVAESNQPVAALASDAMTSLPQSMVNVEVDRPRPDVSSEIADAIAAAQLELGSNGRVLVRPSGTERVVRVMVEAASEEQAERVARELADAVRH